MNSKSIQEAIESWAHGKNFTAPYGIIAGEGTSSKGKKYLSVTFGYARTLDATVEIYNRNFIVLRTSRNGSSVFKDYSALMVELEKL
jgi:hypothetical protein